MANSIGWGQGSINNNIGWGQGEINNNIGWGEIYEDSWSGETNIIGGLAALAKKIVVDNQGSLFVPTLGYVYTNTAGTTLAQVGDKVALIKCFADSGKTGVQSNAANQAVLRIDDDGIYYLDPNGANCYYVTDCGASGIPNLTMVGRGQTTGNGKIYAGCYKLLDNSRAYIGARDTLLDGKIGAGMDGVLWSSLFANTTWSTNKTVAVTRSSTQAKLYVDGVLADTETITGVGSNLNAYLMAGNFDGTPTYYWSGRWYGLAGTLATLSQEDIVTLVTYFEEGNVALQ